MVSPKIILLVEDNPDDEALTLRALRKHRVANEIVVARDGQEALDRLFGENGREPIVPQIVMLDINLPKVNGIDVLKRIRSDERTRTTPVVILTSSAEERDLLAAYSNFVNSFIRKPVNFEQFMEAIGQLGLYWLVLNQSPPGSGRFAEATPVGAKPAHAARGEEGAE